MGLPSVGIAKIQLAIRAVQTQVSWSVSLAFGVVIRGVAFIWAGVLRRSPVWLGKGAVVGRGRANTGFVESSFWAEVMSKQMFFGVWPRGPSSGLVEQRWGQPLWQGKHRIARQFQNGHNSL